MLFEYRRIIKISRIALVAKHNKVEHGVSRKLEKIGTA
jgi:hypothetical protein